VTIIENNKDKEVILFTHHDDPMQGGHAAIAKTINKIKMHYHGKAAIAKTINKIKRHYYWRHMTRSVKEYVH